MVLKNYRQKCLMRHIESLPNWNIGKKKSPDREKQANFTLAGLLTYLYVNIYMLRMWTSPLGICTYHFCQGPNIIPYCIPA